MVYRIRNKNIFQVRAGWKVNYDSKMINKARMGNPDTIMLWRHNLDHHSFLRGTPITTTTILNHTTPLIN
jgi:hypothetical protein